MLRPPAVQSPLFPIIAVLATIFSALDVPSATAGADDDSEMVPDTDRINHSTIGPWGTLQYYHFYLQAPDHLLVHLEPPSARTRWAVPVENAVDLKEALIEAGMPDGEIEAIMDPSLRIVADGLFSVFPDYQTLSSLTKEGRSSLYSFLRRFPCNEYLQSPVQFFSGSVDRWIGASSLRPELRGLIADLTYYRGKALVFSDIPFVLSQCRSESEVMATVKDFSRIRTMVVRLEVNQQTNASELLDYWSTGLNLRRKDMEPMIRAAIATEGVQLIDLLHFLPPLPRKLLYTFPDISMASEGRLPDCHWTSLNFFNYTPQPLYLDERLASTAILERFDPVSPPYRYGDVLMFMSDEGQAYHSCTYLAADIVFSKNGYNLLMPWILANLGDVANLYCDHQGKELNIRGYRRRQ